MSVFWGFWRSHDKKKQPRGEEVACEAARKLITLIVAGGSLGNADRIILQMHLWGCSACQEEMAEQRSKKERYLRG